MTTLPYRYSSVRFRRGWNGRAIGSVATADELTYGQRDALVMRQIAEWVDASQQPKPRQKVKEFAR